MGVGEGRPKARCENGLDVNILSSVGAEDFEQVVEEPVEIDPHRLERLAAGKGEQALRELRRAVGALYRRLHRLCELGGKSERLLRRLLDLPPDRVQIADNDGKQVVEVVRDAARQLSHCFHLLSLPQSLFRLVARFRFGLELRGSRDQTSQGFAGRACQNCSEDQRSQQREADQPAKHVSEECGSRLSLREEVALGGEDRLDLFSDTTQELPVLARIDGGKRRVALSLFGGDYSLAKLLGLGPQKIVELLDARLLEAVVGRERAERIKLGSSRLERTIQWFQIVRVRAQKKTAWSAFCVPGGDKQSLSGLLHLERVQDPHVGNPRPYEADCHRHSRCEHESEANNVD